MTSAALERLPYDSIEYQARHVLPGRTLKRAATAAIFGLGYLAARGLGMVWLAAAWGVVSFREGWREGSRGRHAAGRNGPR
jgi:hypothetical protein